MDNLNELLLQVQKPARYIGGEWNMVKKDWTADRVKVLLAFPEVYEVGMSYLGLKILYGILNKRDDCLCERVFSPWADFEDILRKNRMSLFSLESRRAIKEFDIIGISLAYELNYTNVLNLLDLGGVPIRSSERGEDDPIVIAGGPACYNPEPMSEFIDAFVIGDGEEVVCEIIDAFKLNLNRGKLLKELAKIPGVYVPSLYETAYNNDGTIKSFLPKEKDLPLKIQKRVVKDLDNSFYPTDQIVPYIQIVH
ncbi:MAG: B12-binding domain-containing radical SAM protein, partial [Candidatus Omnitrophota bacterium]